MIEMIGGFSLASGRARGTGLYSRFCSGESSRTRRPCDLRCFKSKHVGGFGTYVPEMRLFLRV